MNVIPLSLVFLVCALVCALCAAFLFRTASRDGRPAWLPLALAFLIAFFLVRTL